MASTESDPETAQMLPSSSEVSDGRSRGASSRAWDNCEHLMRFVVDVMGFRVVESLSLHHTVDWLIQTVQQSYRQQRDLPIAYVREIYSPQLKRCLHNNEQLSSCFGSDKYARMKEIPLVAYLSDSVPETTFERSVSLLPENETSTCIENSDADENNKLTAEHHCCFYWISRLSLLWKPLYKERTSVKCTRIFGQCSFIILAVFYIMYVLHCPFLSKPGFAFSLGKPPELTQVYFVTQGIRYLFLYMLGIWLCYNSHIHHVLRKCSSQVVGQGDDCDWNRISGYITRRAVVSIVVIILPVFTIIPAFARFEHCYEDLKKETLGLSTTTVLVEVVGYMLFCLISLPVFLTMIFIVKVHMAELRKFSRQILIWRTDENTDPVDVFRKIQGAIQYSSDQLQWILSIYYVVMLMWMNACAWLVVNKWIEVHQSGNCWVPQAATRYTVIFATQIVWFYGYPLYYFSKFPRIMRRLVVDISTINYRMQEREGYFINTADVRLQMTTMISTGVQHAPQFVVFWCLPISAFTTVLLICATPVLPLVWKIIAEATN